MIFAEGRRDIDCLKQHNQLMRSIVCGSIFLVAANVNIRNEAAAA